MTRYIHAEMEDLVSKKLTNQRFKGAFCEKTDF